MHPVASAPGVLAKRPTKGGSKLDGDDDIPNEKKREFDRAFALINEAQDIGAALELVEYALELSTNVPGDSKFSNATAALAAFARAVQDIKAAMHLCIGHYYLQALGLLRSVYEAASIGRTMAHSEKVAMKWMNGEWQSDHKARQFVANVMYRDRGQEERAEAVKAYEVTYSNLSEWTHITPKSALAPYIRDLEDDGYSVDLDPYFDENALIFVLEGIAKEALFLAYAVRNAAPNVAVLGARWNQDLEDLGQRLVGDFAVPAGANWEELDTAHRKIMENLRNNSELNKSLKRNRNSVSNLLDET